MNLRFRTVLAAAGAFVMILAGGACASVNPPPSEASLGYTGGPIQGIHFRQVVQPGSGLTWLGYADNHYEYPTTVRTYIVSSEAGEGDKANTDTITAPTSDGIEAHWELAVNFKLNVSRLRKFHESVGLSRDAFWVNDQPSNGWRDMLNDFFRQQIENALQDTSRGLSADDIWRNPETFAKVNNALAASLKDRITAAVGANYFCGPTFSGPVAEDDDKVDCPNMQVAIKRVTLPDDIVRSYANQKVAENAKITAENNGQARVVEAQRNADAAVADAAGKAKAQEQLADIYRDPAYIAYLQALAMQQCAGNPQCTLVVTPGGGVNVNVGK